MFQTILNLSNNKFEQTSGSTLNLNGSLSINSFSATTFTISQQPQQGASGDTILVRGTDGSIRQISQSGITGGGGGATLTFNNGLTEQGGIVSLGGAITGDTKINLYSNYNAYAFTLGGYGSCANGYGAIAIGAYQTKSYACQAIAIGNRVTACGNRSIAIGYNVTSVGDGSINFSNGNILQTVGHGSLADCSSIFGGLNHNISSGNSNATIVGGNTIKLTGNTYIDTTVVGKFAIFSGLTTGTTGDTVLVRDGATGIIKEIPQSGITGGVTLAFDNGLNEDNGVIGLGGTLTVDTIISSGGFFGYGFGIGNQVSPVGRNSIAFGSYTTTLGVNTTSIGYATESVSDGSFSGGIGYFESPDSPMNRLVRSVGTGSFNFSTNNENQIQNYGSLACNSAILGGLNHNISLASERSIVLGGNTNRINGNNPNAAILGGSNITLTGSGYTDTAVVGKFAIFSGLTSGATGDTVLVRDLSTGIIKGISQSSLGGSSGGTAINSNNSEIIFNNGGVISGNTKLQFDSTNNNLRLNSILSQYAVGTNTTVINGNSYTTAAGEYSIAIGKYAQSYGNYSFASSAGISCGSYSFSHSGYAFGNNSVGIQGRAFGLRAIALGVGTRACSENSIAIGRNSESIGVDSISIGNTNVVNANNSAIFGGLNNTIQSGNTNTSLVGGTSLNLTGTSYINHTIVGDFAIFNNPSSGISTDNILVRDNTTGIIKQIPQSGITGGGGGTTELNILDISGATSATLSVNNHVIIVDTTSSSQTITLPSAPQNGLNFKIKDNGNALTNEITISGNTKNIDGESTASINTNYGALELIYQQSVDAWFILSFNN